MKNLVIWLSFLVVINSCTVFSKSSQQPTADGKIEYKHQKPNFKINFYGDYEFNKFKLKKLKTATDFHVFLKKDMKKNSGKSILKANTFVEPFFDCIAILYQKPLLMKQLKNQLLSDKNLQLTNITQDSIIYNTTGQTIYSVSYIILDKKTATKYAHREYFIAADNKTLRLVWVAAEEKDWALAIETSELFKTFQAF